MFTEINGDWPTHGRIILCSCDDKYFDRYFPRFYKTFSEHWRLPIHVHIIDPSVVSLSRLSKMEVSSTWCRTQKQIIDRCVANFLKHIDEDTRRDWFLATYYQAKRFIALGQRMTSDQSVIVADVDCYAQKTPSESQKELIFKDMAFTTYKNKLMATFCNFHHGRLAEIRQMSKHMVKMLEHTNNVGIDQQVIKSVFGGLSYTELTMGEWIRHHDVKSEADKRAHEHCLVYHEKGTRGKNKPVEITWTDVQN